MPRNQLLHQLPTTALAFRGYNVANLGRTAEFLAHAVYGPILREHLEAASTVAAEVLQRPVDLVQQVLSGQEYTLEHYGEALALVLAIEAAQLAILEKVFQIDYRRAQFAFGFSLGEIGAVAAGGVLDFLSAMRIPLSLADDCAALAHGVTLGVLFTRSRELLLDDVQRLCLQVNQEGRGVVGISAQLAPNTLLVLGQQDTLDRLLARAREQLNVRVHLKKNDRLWPPVHTPIVWERQIPNRAAQQMHTLPLALEAPRPPVFSLVTGSFGYTAVSARDLLYRWIDHPQRLWDAVYHTLASGATTVLHLGPAPNIIPATFQRLSADVLSQTQESLSLRALSAAVRRQWLRRILPERTALLRAPYVEQIILEDWLLSHAPT